MLVLMLVLMLMLMLMLMRNKRSKTWRGWHRRIKTWKNQLVKMTKTKFRLKVERD